MRRRTLKVSHGADANAQARTRSLSLSHPLTRLFVSPSVLTNRCRQLGVLYFNYTCYYFFFYYYY